MKHIDKKTVSNELKKCMSFIGDVIRKERLKQGISQQTLAYHLESDKCLISEIERGCTKNITLCTLMKISYVLEIPLFDLISK